MKRLGHSQYNIHRIWMSQQTLTLTEIDRGTGQLKGLENRIGISNVIWPTVWRILHSKRVGRNNQLLLSLKWMILKFCVDFDWTVSDGVWYCLCLYGVCGLWLTGSSWVYHYRKPQLGHWQLYRLFNDFIENSLKGVYVYQDDICDIISRSDHLFKGYDQKLKRSICTHHWMRQFRFHVHESLSTLWLKIRWRNMLHSFCIVSTDDGLLSLPSIAFAFATPGRFRNWMLKLKNMKICKKCSCSTVSNLYFRGRLSLGLWELER